MKENSEVEHSIIKEFRKNIWNNFTKAIEEFELIKDGDKIAVCISGGKDSLLLAKCINQLKIINKIKFDVVYLCMNPGYSDENMNKILENTEKLNIPLVVFNTKIFDAIKDVEDNPCYICASIRRKKLYLKAKELGCNKIALGHHLNDIIETILMGMIFGSQIQTMKPKLKSKFHENMELIRPLYYVKEDDIISWKNMNEIECIDCTCKVSKIKKDSKRKVVKVIINELKKDNEKIEMNILRSVENVNLETLISYSKNNEVHHFLDNYDE